MSAERMNRRRFLADMLFAGGALGATALAARYLTSPEPPSPPPPVAVKPTPPPEMHPQGGMMISPPIQDGCRRQ